MSDLLSGYAGPPPPHVSGRMCDRHRRALDRICALPDMAPLVTGLQLSVDADLELPLTVRGGRLVALHPANLEGPADAAPIVRLAAELALWQRLAGGAPSPATELAIGVLAWRVAAKYAASHGHATAQLGHGSASPWWTELTALVAADPLPTNETLDAVARHAPRLLGIQGRPAAAPPEGVGEAVAAIAPILSRCAELAAPVELLLTSGGDSRLRLDPDRGLNHYGCSPRPRPEAITFASCTATSISEPAYARAEALRRRLIESALRADLDPAFGAEMERVKSEVAALCGAGPGTEVILTTSGTDAELCALQLALGGATGRLTNIVLGGREAASAPRPRDAISIRRRRSA